MRSLSVRDLLVAEELSHIKNEIDLIHPQNDELVKFILHQIGFDTRHEIQYIPSLHRDLKGKVAVGFQVVGEYSTDHKYRKFMDTLDRVIICGMKDISLGRELAAMMGSQLQYHNDPEADNVSDAELENMGFTEGDGGDDAQEGYEELRREIEQLKMICASIREEG